MNSPRSTVSLLLLCPALAAQSGMIYIPAGEFVMGRTHADKNAETKWFPNILKDDQPARRVFADAFYLDEHEVTNAEYGRFVQAKSHRAPPHWPHGKLPKEWHSVPVTNVSWDDAHAYAQWAGKRLPTEAEWERACRGLSESLKYFHGADKLTAADARFDSVEGPVPVCQLQRNDFALCDMAGNAFEWTADWYEQKYYERAPAKNPPGPESGRYRVIRGGSWADVAEYLSCSYRGWVRPSERSPNIGFRCAKSAGGQR